MTTSPESDAALLRDPGHLLALGLGTGLVPLAPGTAGTLVGVLLFLPLQSLTLPAYGLVVLALFVLGLPLCARTARRLGLHDHPAIVWDEVVGYLVTMSAAPVGWPWMLAGFVLFRFFDILKPWPIAWLDRFVTGGLGIMLDDALAGVYAGLVLSGLVLLTGVLGAT
ncbi:MAG: phosphatidylglycerophosphatase A [Candidatus Competibacterales bacterium]|nr:phosphatidylglycerophosphatase A [Candidatus Competibacterales bacterium]